MQCRIYPPPKTAMQSGRAGTQKWVLSKFDAPGARREADPLMGWTRSEDTRRQLRLTFDSRKRRSPMPPASGLAYVLEEPNQRRICPRPIPTISAMTGRSRTH